MSHHFYIEMVLTLAMEEVVDLALGYIAFAVESLLYPRLIPLFHSAGTKPLFYSLLLVMLETIHLGYVGDDADLRPLHLIQV